MGDFICISTDPASQFDQTSSKPFEKNGRGSRSQIPCLQIKHLTGAIKCSDLLSLGMVSEEKKQRMRVPQISSMFEFIIVASIQEYVITMPITLRIL